MEWIGYGIQVLFLLIALNGLQTWRRQLTGTAEYELARRLMRAALAVRDAIGKFRRPFFPASEILAAVEEAGGEDQLEKAVLERRGFFIARNLRWNHLVSCLTDFESECLEAEVLEWAIRDSATPLQGCVQDLNIALRSVETFEQQQASGAEIQLPEEDLKVIAGIEADDDEFWKKVKGAIEGIRELVKPHLKREQPLTLWHGLLDLMGLGAKG